MNGKRFRVFYLLSLAGLTAASFYPIYMGIQVVVMTLQNGAVPMESYPKYVIPYTPIAVALIFGVLIMPIFQAIAKKLDFLCGAVFSMAVFLVVERLAETKILVQSTEVVPLEGWQMSLCYVPPEQYRTRTWQAVDVLLGGYSPAFKLHFYLISAAFILSALNCFYGFGKMLRTGERTRKKALTIQSITSLAFLGMCIWACLTSFYRTGELTVSPLSAALMTAFFALLGVTAGVFAGSFTIGKARIVSVWLPAAVAAAAALAMYVGEMILLNGNLYRFGAGFFFEALGAAVLAPVDVLVILVSGGAAGLICMAFGKGSAR